MDLLHRKAQSYKFSNKNDHFCAWRDFNKTFCGISTYQKWMFKQQISSIFNFDRAHQSWISGLLGVKYYCEVKHKETVLNKGLKSYLWLTHPTSSTNLWFKAWFHFYELTLVLKTQNGPRFEGKKVTVCVYLLPGH